MEVGRERLTLSLEYHLNKAGQDAGIAHGEDEGGSFKDTRDVARGGVGEQVKAEKNGNARSGSR